jgi:methionyl-tRNA formyltransferase
LDRIERGAIERHSQDAARATYAPKIASQDARLDLGLDAAAFARRVRAFTPEPGAYVELDGGRLQVLEAAPGEADAVSSAPGTVRAVDRARGLEIELSRGTVWLRTVKPSGRRAMGAFDYANGARLSPGTRLPLREPSA